MQSWMKSLVVAACVFAGPVSANYAERPEVLAMADRLAEQGVDRDRVLAVMGEAKRLDSVINAMNRPAERKQ